MILQFQITNQTEEEQELIPELEQQKVRVLKLDGRETPSYNISKIYSEIGYEKN